MCEFVTWVEQLPHATDWKKFEIVIHFLSFPHVILGQKPAKSTFFSCDAAEDLKNHYQTAANRCAFQTVMYGSSFRDGAEKGPSGLQRMALTKESHVSELWAGIGSRLSEKHLQTCNDISDAMLDQFMVTSIDSMFANITVQEASALVSEHGGNQGWIRTLEFLGEGTFIRPTEQYPQPQPQTCGGKQARFPDVKIGEELALKKELDDLQIPLSALAEAHVDPLSNGRLSINDFKRVTTACWTFIFQTTGNVGSDCILFGHIAKQLTTAFGEGSAVTPNGTSWEKALMYRWNNARRVEVGALPTHTHTRLVRTKG